MFDVLQHGTIYSLRQISLVKPEYLMLINFHISLITKRFLLSFDRHSDKTVTLSELLNNINKFRNQILKFFQKVSRMWLLNCSSYCDTCLESH